DINVEIIKILFFELQSTNKHSKELFERFSVGEIFQNTLLCFVRGISTLKGIELIDDIQRRNYPYFGDKKLCMKKCKTKKNQ
ncbi:MAG: hypothetical protein LBH82_06180, partial [Bacteroidales bacterium]|nr:hypothetical protein [Bacteroidales bacterium]